ncbi:MAG: peptidyl-prolyl cis-trans isomerase [Planctomycetota bacterium]
MALDTSHRFVRLLQSISLVWLCLTAAGCDSSQSRGPEPLRGVERSEADTASRASATGGTAERPPLLVNGRAVPWSSLRPLLAEAAGAIAIEEIALDAAIEQTAQQAGVTVTRADINREQDLLVRSIAADASLDRGEAQRVAETIRRNRGLGPDRFARLLRRNALLRALVQPEIEIGEDELRTAYEVLHGERYVVRVLVVERRADAARFRSEIAAAADPERRFIELAGEHSTDATASRGGLTEPISPADPAYPAAIRAVVDGLQPGQLSTVVALDGSFAVVRGQAVVPGSGRSSSAVRGSLEERVRTRQERIAMDALSRRLLESSQIAPFDESLGWSWRTRPRRGQ